MTNIYNILEACFYDGLQGITEIVGVMLFGFRHLCCALCYSLPYSLICC